jgi:small multidrug resistance family-3 protein
MGSGAQSRLPNARAFGNLRFFWLYGVAAGISSAMKYLTIFGLLIITTALEACGDAVIRMGLVNQAALPARIGLFAAGTVLLLGYGTTLNLAPQEFGKLIGAYVATFFIMAQVINLIFFRTTPSLPIWVGGAFILAGGMIVTFWQPDSVR